MIENEKKNALLIKYICTVHSRSSETKNGLFYKQGAPHTDSLAAPAYQCSVQYFTFGQYFYGPIHPNSSASNQTKIYAATTNSQAFEI